MVVTSRLTDRFGNLLFKIAAGKYLADQIGAKWKGIYTDSHRFPGYIEELVPFFKDLSVEKEDKDYQGANPVYERGPMNYTPIKESADDCFLEGYRQCPAYWNNNKQYVLNLFRTEYDGDIYRYIRQLYPELDFRNLIAINARRGDYIKWENQANIGFYDESYYLECISKFSPEDKFLVISDDIPWCKTFLTGNRFYFADKPKSNWTLPVPTYLVDFYIQRMCKHNIIANSTFSWWAAYLNETPGRKVFCPKTWGRFCKGSLDFVPKNDNWELIDHPMVPAGVISVLGIPRDNKPNLEDAVKLRYRTEDGTRVKSFNYIGPKQSSVIIVPTHKPFDHLNLYEQESFRNTCKVFSNRPVVLLVPENLDVSGYKSVVQQKIYVLEGMADFFRTESGYFTFFKCPDIYKTLLGYFRYMLLIHLDSWAFYDGTAQFEKYGYSYCGAPWYGQVVPNGSIGNGGFCMINLEDAYKIITADWLDKQNVKVLDYIADDTYFGLTIHEGFTVAPVHVALEFAFDDHPEHAIQQTKGKIPMGCHAFYRFGHEQFWKQVIPILNNIQSTI